MIKRLSVYFVKNLIVSDNNLEKLSILGPNLEMKTLSVKNNQLSSVTLTPRIFGLIDMSNTRLTSVSFLEDTTVKNLDLSINPLNYGPTFDVNVTKFLNLSGTFFNGDLDIFNQTQTNNLLEEIDLSNNNISDFEMIK